MADDPENSKDSLFDDDDDIVEEPSAAKTTAAATTKVAPLEDSAKGGPDRPDPRKKAVTEYSEADIDAELESDSMEIEHGALTH